MNKEAALSELDFDKNWDAIRCPYCKAEYHPAEIYLPGELTGTPSKVIKSPLGKILYTEYAANKERELVQHYQCDTCNRSFKVFAKVTYSAEAEDEEADFSSLSSSLL